MGPYQMILFLAIALCVSQLLECSVFVPPEHTPKGAGGWEEWDSPQPWMEGVGKPPCPSTPGGQSWDFHEQ